MITNTTVHLLLLTVCFCWSLCATVRAEEWKYSDARAFMGGWNQWSHAYDLQNDHCSINWNSRGSINQDVPVQFRNPALYALPSGLSQIMR